MSGPPLEPFEGDPAMPKRTGVVVVGGGIIGASTAYALARQGIPVVLCEKGRIAGEQSGRSWGWVRKQGRDPRETPVMIESARIWAGLNAELQEETGYRNTGNITMCLTERELARRAAWLEHARQYQLDSRLLGSAEVDRLMPGAATRFKGALYTASDGQAEPQKAAPAIARGARRHGAIILTGCAVRGIESSAGRVIAAVTEKGRIDCDAVVLAGGAWSRLFCGNLGIELPQLKVRSTVLRTCPLRGGDEAAPGIAAVADRVAFRRRLDGGYLIANFRTTAEIVPDSFRLARQFLPALRAEWKYLRLRPGIRFAQEAITPRRWLLDGESPFERTRELDPRPQRRDNAAALHRLGRLFPVFRQAQVAQDWAGLIDTTPDAIPVMSAVEGTAGFFIAAGFSGHGFAIGPGAGRLLADLVTGAPPIVDPAPFRLSRFTDGTNPRPQLRP
jgi:glycine/D-amino acid oxidase-like deaminating enzyme